MSGARDNTRPKICLIGAGNVATHLAHAFSQVSEIVQIYSHTLSNAISLADAVGGDINCIDHARDVTPMADYYIVSVHDDNIQEIAMQTPDAGIWAHTSGSVPMSVFEGYKSHYGVFYPLQTFSKTVLVNIHEVPFFIEGSNPEVTDRLMELASQISENVEWADSSKRQSLHISAVFACNFVNYMWIHAADILKHNGLDFKTLLPLLNETLRKVNLAPPEEVQTGPARRGDMDIINSHLDKLQGESKDIYRFLSQYILNHYSNNE